MRRFYPLVLLGVGSLALSLCSVAAHADSIPTLTATTASYSDLHGGPARWSVAGDSFGFGGFGYAPVVYGFGQPGQSLERSGLTRVLFGEFRGPGFSDTGQLTLDGVTHLIEPLGSPIIIFSAKDIFVPYGPDPVFSAPAAVLGGYPDNRPIGLGELLCDPSQDTTHSCYSSKVLANAYIDVPGIVTFHAFGPEDRITEVEFTSTPEPVSAGLATFGMTAMLILVAFRKRETSMRHIQSLVLLGVGSLVLSLCPVAACADSIPTLTATSLTYSHSGINQWSISGDSFAVGGAGETSGTPFAFNVGESIADLYPRIPFGETIGATPASTTGYVILDGVTHYVALSPTPEFVIPSSSTYHPVIVGPSQSYENAPGAFDTVANVPVVVRTFDIYTNGNLSQLLEPPCGFPSNPQCSQNLIANVAIDLPGILAINGYQYPGDSYGFITTIDFASTPEPGSLGLIAAGLATAFGFTAFRRRHGKMNHDLG